jgi:hypothetical protein
MAMCGFLWRRLAGAVLIVLAISTPLHAQHTDTFRWMDFHSEKDQSVIVWVTRALTVESWTSIREIGVIYDAALVETTDRATPQSMANADTFTIWSVSLTNHMVVPLVRGVNLRWVDWMQFRTDGDEEQAVLYDNCRQCAANTYFTALYYDPMRHQWAARWMRGGQGALVWSSNVPEGMTWTQVYAAFSEPDGHQILGTWNHFDYGRQKPPGDFVYQYDVDWMRGMDRVQMLTGADADAMKMHVCDAQDAVPGLARGQDTPLCQPYIRRMDQRKPATTPANNQGRSAPPGSRPHH